MITCTTSKARANLFKLVERAAHTHHPIQITSKHASAILIGEEDWRAIEETLYLLSVPGMRESIRKGLQTPIKKLSKSPGW